MKQAEALLSLAEDERINNGRLVVDEAFMDVGTTGMTLAPDVGHGSIVVLRSFGKFFGLAGMRLGFALAAPEAAERLRLALGPWAVSGPAIAVGARALADQDWIDTTRVRLAVAAMRLDALLNEARLQVIGGTPLFRCVQASSAALIFSAWVRLASSCAASPIGLTCCASACRAMSRPGNGFARRCFLRRCR